jgi:hypothetical protein
LAVLVGRVREHGGSGLGHHIESTDEIGDNKALELPEWGCHPVADHWHVGDDPGRVDVDVEGAEVGDRLRDGGRNGRVANSSGVASPRPDVAPATSATFPVISMFVPFCVRFSC